LTQPKATEGLEKNSSSEMPENTLIKLHALFHVLRCKSKIKPTRSTDMFHC
jgi:hypothetical protein